MLSAARNGVMTQTLPAASLESITIYVKADHRRLDALLHAVCADVEAGRLRSAQLAYEAFDSGLARHIRFEEQLLFPLFEARVGIVGGPTATLRQEHRQIEHAAALMRDALDRSDAQAFRDGCAFLRALLPQHDSKEEHVLFPTTDRALSDAERAAVLRRLRRE
jgi:hemerythrin-like domain-containing protein